MIDTAEGIRVEVGTGGDGERIRGYKTVELNQPQRLAGDNPKGARQTRDQVEE